jgi:hypothetical protein
MISEMRNGFPIVRLEADFRGPSRIGDALTIALWVPVLGGASLHLHYAVTCDGPAARCARVIVTIVSTRTPAAIATRCGLDHLPRDGMSAAGRRMRAKAALPRGAGRRRDDAESLQRSWRRPCRRPLAPHQPAGDNRRRRFISRRSPGRPLRLIR